MSLQASTVNILVNVYDKDFVPLIADDIIIDGTLVPLYGVNNASTANINQRVQDNVTVQVGKTLYNGYSQVFNTHYGTDGNLEQIVINVVMFPIATVAADLASYITNFCIPPITRIKGTHPDGDEYTLYATMNEGSSYTVDWEYPVSTPIGTGQTVTAQFGVTGLKVVGVTLDDGLGNDCSDTYKFILPNLNVNACLGQDLVNITDIDDNELCAGLTCFEPYDFGTACCVHDLVTRKFNFINLDDNEINISPTDCLLNTEIVTDSNLFNFFNVSSFTVGAGQPYTVTIQLQTDPETCACGVQTGTVWISMAITDGVGECCNKTWDVKADIQDKSFLLSDTTVNMLTAVGDCVQATIFLVNSGCANLKVPTMANSAGGCFEVDQIIVNIDYDQAQLAALPLDGDGDHYLIPGNTIDINLEYCPDQVQSGCCNALDFIGECNTAVLEICYQSIVPPSCIEFLLMPCENIKLSVPDDSNTIDQEPPITCVTPNIDLRFSGNAFFPPCDATGCEDEDCTLTVDWINTTTGDTLSTQTFDPETFSYITTPIWNYILQFPSAGIWEATITASWCANTLICTKRFTVCHEIDIKRIKCHVRRISVNTTTDQDVTVLVESIFDDSFVQEYTFNTSVQSFVDVVLPADGAYRVTITFGIDEEEQVLYIDEICGVAECYRAMVLKILCNEANPCCKNCDPKEVEAQKKLRYMINQIMALFLSTIAFIHKDTMNYLGVWEDDECRQASQQEIAQLIEQLKNSILRCGVCEESIASQITTSGCRNC